MEKINLDELPDTDFLSTFNESSPEQSTSSDPPPPPPLTRKPKSPSAKNLMQKNVDNNSFLKMLENKINKRSKSLFYQF